MSDSTALTAYTAPLPFSNKQVCTQVPAGSTLAHMVDVATPAAFDGAPVGAVVMINGEVIPRAYWGQIRPKQGTLINIRIVPTGGGGGGKKNPIATLLSIAVMVAAPYVAGAILGTAITTSTTLGATLLTKGVTAAIGIVGSLAINAIAPPPSPSVPAYSSGSGLGNPAESPTQFIEGAQNSITPFGVIPVNLGRNRMFPLQAARPFTELQGNDQYVRQLFTYGYGDALDISELKIGETDISEFDNFEIEHKTSGNLHEGVALYSNDVFQDDYSILMDASAGWITRTTQLNADEVILDFIFSQGLVLYSSAGTRNTAIVEYEIEYSPAGQDSWQSIFNGEIRGSQKEALRKAHRFVFPETGQYDIRVKRNSPDSTSDRLIDTMLFTTLKTVTYQTPVTLDGINGTAVRIKATDQLNGALSQFNCMVGTHLPDYDASLGIWVTRATSNPASIYRYVLQGMPNARRLADERIDIAALEDWHTHCENEGYTYNRIIDFDISVNGLLRDVASAGAASPAIVDGKRTVVIDREKPIITQMVTPRNSWDYKGEMTYPVLPHAFRVQFRNEDKGLKLDEIIVYDDGYDASNASEFEVLELQYCTNAALAFKTGRRHIASVRLRPETHSFMMDIENIVCLRGDRILLEHDAPLIGIGDGRIKAINMTGTDPDKVASIEIDDTIGIPKAGTYFVRVRLGDGSYLYREIDVNVGYTSTLTFADPVDVEDMPAIGDLLYVVEAGQELDLLITKIEPQANFTARITAVDYAQPQIKDAENAAVPAWVSNVTTPLEFMRPAAPKLIAIQGDESAMLLNSDGSYTARAIITLDNPNDGDVIPHVKVRLTGTDVFAYATVLSSNPESISITGLEDGKSYDIHVRYKRGNSSMLSAALEINNYQYIGASAAPAGVKNFKINVAGETAHFKWDKNQELDISHYTVKYSPLYAGASYDTAQALETKVYENRLSTLFRGGTYMIKAVDILGNESEAATAIITHNPAKIANAVAVLNEAPTFAGTHDNTVKSGDTLTLQNPSQVGIYSFADVINLDGVYDAVISSTLIAGGTYANNLYDIDDLYAEADLYGGGGNDMYAMDDMHDVADLYGIGVNAWTVTQQYSITQTDPEAGGAVWSDWADLEDGILQFYAIKFRLVLTSLQDGIAPAVYTAQINVDMPDRTTAGEDVSVDIDGVSIPFAPAYRATPAIAITVQDGAVDDRIEYISKSAEGFSFKIFNESAGTYVARTFDYIASGYGRKNTP